ncbi:MAG: nicotinate (nicotinamide) nucleotide adenylyltransferase [Deltaproteobacteria bacterium]|nr:MAG: nicotinate (nicotinamide) nucleotide adenylyltransferase [Deltaproteobacteria bacterium]
MKYGIFGGTFDPIHMGHLRTAVEIVYKLELTKLFLVPAATPPHKRIAFVSEFQHRFNMARMAVGRSSTLEVLDLEAKRKGPSYSIDTLRELSSSLGPGNDLYFILGLEAFFEIHTWKEYHRLFELSHFVVVDRKGYNFEEVVPYLKKLGIDATSGPGSDTLILASGRSLIHQKPTQMDISSTQIRALVKKGWSIRFLVPDQVMDYILENGLYA